MNPPTHPSTHPLTTPTGRAALDLATEQADPASLAAASALRHQFSPELSAAALAQAALRRKARSKFGDAADSLLFTSAGLEQATRPAVAAWRAQRFAQTGVRTVLDLGCGIGTDARAFAAAGLRVIGVELDQETAEVARHNLAGLDAEVICGDAVSLTPQLLADADPNHLAVFLDPARRTDRGRTWRVDQFTPSWDFVLAQLTSGRPTCVKLGPGLPGELLPDGVEARWVSCGGDVVEVGLWQLPGLTPGRAATLLHPSAESVQIAELGPLPRRDLDPRTVGRYLYEPNGAVLRAGLASYLADAAPDLGPVAPGVGYLTCDTRFETPFATGFEVLAELDFSEKSLRAWTREHQIGTLEIKKRAVDLDPAELRKRLKLRGANSASIIITPTVAGVRAYVVRRLS